MNFRFITRLPWFELSILLILTAIGWAAWELNRFSKAQNQLQEGTQLEPVGDAFQERVGKEFRQTWVRHVLNNSNAVQTIREANEANRLPEAYRLVAEQLQAELPRIHTNLVRYSSRTVWRDQSQWEKGTQELLNWVWNHQLQWESERLVAQSQELAATGTHSLTLDLGSLCRDAERRLTNYIAKGQSICILARMRTNTPPASTNSASKPIAAGTSVTQTNSSVIRDELTEARSMVQGLLELAGTARTEAVKLDQQPVILPDPLEKVEHELAQVGNETLKSAVLAQQQKMLAEQQRMLAGMNERYSHLQPVFYAMLAAGVGLTLFLTIAIYRRVVERLNFKLYESTTENKMAHLGQVAAWLAHEIKQPLTAINAWLWTLQKRVKKEMPEHMGTMAIRREINRLDQIVKDFLRFTQPATPKLVPMKAGPVLQEVLELLGPQLERQGIRLNLDARVEASFSADPHQLKQVLINLITNAAESIETEGTITVRARRDHAPLNGRPADAILIEVEDTGSGIAPDVQQRLFDPFFSTKEEGTGLGLPIARKIIDAHGGVLEFKSALDTGTTFRIVLPLARTAN